MDGEDVRPLLPVVSERVGASLQNELASATTEAYVLGVLTRLCEENPCIANFIARSALERGDLERVLPEWTLPAATLSLVWPGSRQTSRRLRAFLDFAAPRLKARLSPDAA